MAADQKGVGVTYVGELSFRGETLVMRHGEWNSPMRPRDGGQFEWGRQSQRSAELAVALLGDAAGSEAAKDAESLAGVAALVQSLPWKLPPPPSAAISGVTIELGWAESWRLTREQVLSAAGLPKVDDGTVQGDR